MRAILSIFLLLSLTASDFLVIITDNNEQNISVIDLNKEKESEKENQENVEDETKKDTKTRSRFEASSLSELPTFVPYSDTHEIKIVSQSFLKLIFPPPEV